MEKKIIRLNRGSTLAEKSTFEHDHLAFDLFLPSLWSQDDNALGEGEGTFLMVILTLAFECKAILDISKRFQKKKKWKKEQVKILH